MALTKKETKHYKPLIIRKLEEMKVKNEVGYTQTGTFRYAKQLVPDGEGKFKVQTSKVPNYRASNLQKSLVKKLLALTSNEVERFLATEVPTPEAPKDDMAIDGATSE